MFSVHKINVSETFLLRTQNICLIGEKTDNEHFGGLYILMSITL